MGYTAGAGGAVVLWRREGHRHLSGDGLDTARAARHALILEAAAGRRGRAGGGGGGAAIRRNAARHAADRDLAVLRVRLALDGAATREAGHRRHLHPLPDAVHAAREVAELTRGRAVLAPAHGPLGGAGLRRHRRCTRRVAAGAATAARRARDAAGTCRAARSATSATAGRTRRAATPAARSRGARPAVAAARRERET